jgi:hypothetical protein
LLRLLLGSVWDDDAAGRLFLGIDALDNDTIVKGAEIMLSSIRRTKLS